MSVYFLQTTMVFVSGWAALSPQNTKGATPDDADVEPIDEFMVRSLYILSYLFFANF